MGGTVYPYGDDWVTFIESIVEEGIQDVLMAVEDGLAAAGPRPYGMLKGSTVEQLEAYFAFRDDPQAWADLIASWSAQVGPRNAQYYAVREATRLENLSKEYGGVEGVLTALVAQGISEHQRALQEAEKILASTPITILPPNPPFNPVDALMPQPPPSTDLAITELGPAPPANAPAADPLALQFISRRRQVGPYDVVHGEPFQAPPNTVQQPGVPPVPGG